MVSDTDATGNDINGYIAWYNRAVPGCDKPVFSTASTGWIPGNGGNAYATWSYLGHSYQTTEGGSYWSGDCRSDVPLVPNGPNYNRCGVSGELAGDDAGALSDTLTLTVEEQISDGTYVTQTLTGLISEVTSSSYRVDNVCFDGGCSQRTDSRASFFVGDAPEPATFGMSLLAVPVVMYFRKKSPQKKLKGCVLKFQQKQKWVKMFQSP